MDMKAALAAVRAYQIWMGMHSRCRAPKATGYARYGGRGIKVCARWEKLECFLEDMGLPADGLSLDRADNDGPYSPENCRWATASVQANNKKNSLKVTLNGETKTLAQWAKDLSIPRGTLVRRYKEGRSPAEILQAENLPPNIADARRAMLAMRRAATHCKQGHEFTSENTVTAQNGTRHCKECGRARAREHYRKKAGTAGRKLKRVTVGAIRVSYGQ